MGCSAVAARVRAGLLRPRALAVAERATVVRAAQLVRRAIIALLGSEHRATTGRANTVRVRAGTIEERNAGEPNGQPATSLHAGTQRFAP